MDKIEKMVDKLEQGERIEQMFKELATQFRELATQIKEPLDILRTLKKAGRKPKQVADDAKKARQTLEAKILNAVRDAKEVSVRDLFRKNWMILDKRAATQDIKDACYALEKIGCVRVEKKGTKIMVSYVRDQNIYEEINATLGLATKELEGFMSVNNTEQQIKTDLQKSSEDLAKMLEPGPERPEQQEVAIDVAIDTDEASKTFQDDPGQAIPAKTTEDSTLTKTSTTEAINDFDDFYDFI